MKLKSIKAGIDYHKLLKNARRGLLFLHRNSVVTLAILGGLLAYLAINSAYTAVTAGSSPEAYEEELSTFRSINFDEEVIQSIVELVENDVDIRAKLPDSRDNPFLDF